MQTDTHAPTTTTTSTVLHSITGHYVAVYSATYTHHSCALAHTEACVQTHARAHTHTLSFSLSLQADMHTYMYAHMAGGVCVQKSLKKRKVVIWLAKLS